jgi:hypothetical protein
VGIPHPLFPSVPSGATDFLLTTAQGRFIFELTSPSPDPAFIEDRHDDGFSIYQAISGRKEMCDIRQGTKTALIILILTITGIACSEKPKNPVGFDLWDEKGHWQVHQLISQNVVADSSYHVSRGTGIGPYLLVGSWEGQEARSLMSFEEDLPDPDTLAGPLSEVKLNIIAYSEVSDDSILISVYPLETPWRDSTATWEVPWTTAGGDYGPEPIAEGFFATGGGAQFEMEFSAAGVELVQGWLNGQPNNGIILKADELEDDHLKYFNSEDTPYYPYLQLVFTAQDTSDTITVDSEKDTFIAEPVALPGEDLLMVSDVPVTRTWLQFDISAIPESSFINLAVLSLSVSEFKDPLDNMTIRAYPVSDRQTLDYETSPYASSNLFTGKELAEFNITTLVQNWITGTENEGILLKPYLEYSSLSQALFYSSAADSSHRPALKIVYTLRPEDVLTSRKPELGAK